MAEPCPFCGQTPHHKSCNVEAVRTLDVEAARAREARQRQINEKLLEQAAARQVQVARVRGSR